MSQKLAKRNIVDGGATWDSFYRAMPAIAQFIEADYDEQKVGVIEIFL